MDKTLPYQGRRYQFGSGYPRIKLTNAREKKKNKNKRVYDIITLRTNAVFLPSQNKVGSFFVNRGVVAQFGRASALQSEGCWFKPIQLHKKNKNCFL